LSDSGKKGYRVSVIGCYRKLPHVLVWNREIAGVELLIGFGRVNGWGEVVRFATTFTFWEGSPEEAQ
jgi:hypothetical protein